MHRIPTILVLLSGCAALASLGCDSHVPLGALSADVPNVFWHATFEPGDLSEWKSGDEGGTWSENAADPTVTSDQVHAGRYAGKPTIGPTTGGPGMASSSYFNRDLLPPQGYYSAWYYIPSTVTVRSWLSLSHFRCSPTGDGLNPTAIWDLNIWPVVDGSLPPGTLPSGSLTTHFYNYITRENADQLVTLAVPTDQWVHFEIRLDKATTATGHISVWQDDVMIIDLPSIVTTQSAWVEWDVGGSSNDLSPSTASIYVDDASISLQRLGDESLSDALRTP